VNTVSVINGNKDTAETNGLYNWHWPQTDLINSLIQLQTCVILNSKNTEDSNHTQ